MAEAELVVMVLVPVVLIPACFIVLGVADGVVTKIVLLMLVVLVVGIHLVGHLVGLLEPQEVALVATHHNLMRVVAAEAAL